MKRAVATLGTLLLIQLSCATPNYLPGQPVTDVPGAGIELVTPDVTLEPTREPTRLPLERRLVGIKLMSEEGQAIIGLAYDTTNNGSADTYETYIGHFEPSGAYFHLHDRLDKVGDDL